MNSAPPSWDSFRPLPLIGNPHVQTVLGFALPGPRFRYPVEKKTLRFDDGDALVYHDSIPTGWKQGRPIAVLVHGLGGSASSKPILRMAKLLLDRAVRVIRVDLRGAGDGLTLARRFYHAGRSEDVRAVLDAIHQEEPTSPLLLLGISLGGNLALKLAAEAEDFDPLIRVAAMSPPIDLGRCAFLIGRRANRRYERHFLEELTEAARVRQRCFPDLPELAFPKRMTIVSYDNVYTAPRSGFADSGDYYRSCSAFPLIARIRIPTVLLTARDDPFIAVEPFDLLRPPGNVEVRIVENGGHIGFLGWHKSGTIRWAEQHLVEWLLEDLPAW